MIWAVYVKRIKLAIELITIPHDPFISKQFAIEASKIETLKFSNVSIEEQSATFKRNNS